MVRATRNLDMGAMEPNEKAGPDARTFRSLSPVLTAPGMLRRRALRAMSHSGLRRPGSARGRG